MIKRFLFDWVEMDCTGIAVYERVQSSSPVYSDLAFAPIAFGDNAAPGTKIAANVGARVRRVTIGQLQGLLISAVTVRAIQ
jgi:hypothetical protein